MTNVIAPSAMLGATVGASNVHFRVWAPEHATVDVELDGASRLVLPLLSEANGYFSAYHPEAQTGDLYRYRLSGAESHPDPYSRCQPKGPHGPSMIVDPSGYDWQDSAWQGIDPSRQVLYELHIGTFTSAGTYESAGKHLERLSQLGITCIEIMPVNEFSGRFGWGYDGVNWFAPYHRYGTPDELRTFIDGAHRVGVGVILDVVYNHFGHDGNYLPRFSSRYLTDKVQNPWGGAPDYACQAMRRLAIDNAAYWMREFHFDGLRLDAIQNIHDPDCPTLLRELVREAREAAHPRCILIAAEDYLQRSNLIGATGTDSADIDCLWNDDFHHACRTALTGNHHGFFKNYRGTPQEILSSLKHGFLFQGQYDGWGRANRGTPGRGEPLSSRIAFIQNHDAVANTLDGQRAHSLASPARFRALTAVVLLGPQTPLIFMGQEFSASSPFAYFADYPDDDGTLWSGRQQEAAQFLPYRDANALARIMNPCSIDTMKASTLNHAERNIHVATYQLYGDLIALRRQFGASPTPREVDGAVLTEGAFVFRWFEQDRPDRLLIVNLGPQVELRAFAEPLLAPPRHSQWFQRWSSEHVDYGGMGEIEARTDEGWQFSSDSAYLLESSAVAVAQP